MNPVPDNEVEILLRKLGRGGEEGSSSDSDLDQHLDADELNAYAENALPAAARAKYTEHLADCSSCRKIVAQLAVVSAPLAVAKESEQSSWNKLVSRLFSPLTLRYAVPGLAALVILAVVFISY